MPTDLNREAYERDLAERQRQHLERVQGSAIQSWRPCMHDACSQCVGTGIKQDGSACIHMISCPCPRCTPSYSIYYSVDGGCRHGWPIRKARGDEERR